MWGLGILFKTTHFLMGWILRVCVFWKRRVVPASKAGSGGFGFGRGFRDASPGIDPAQVPVGWELECTVLVTSLLFSEETMSSMDISKPRPRVPRLRWILGCHSLCIPENGDMWCVNR